MIYDCFRKEQIQTSHPASHGVAAVRLRGVQQDVRGAERAAEALARAHRGEGREEVPVRCVR